MYHRYMYIQIVKPLKSGPLLQDVEVALLGFGDFIIITKHLLTLRYPVFS